MTEYGLRGCEAAEILRAAQDFACGLRRPHRGSSSNLPVPTIKISILQKRPHFRFSFCGGFCGDHAAICTDAVPIRVYWVPVSISAALKNLASSADISRRGCSLRKTAQTVFAILLIGAIFLMLALVCGVTPDGLLYGHWPDIDDHPTNWTDTGLHP
jgi:hypothetical protein